MPAKDVWNTCIRIIVQTRDRAVAREQVKTTATADGLPSTFVYHEIDLSGDVQDAPFGLTIEVRAECRRDYLEGGWLAGTGP